MGIQFSINRSGTAGETLQDAAAGSIASTPRTRRGGSMSQRLDDLSPRAGRSPSASEIAGDFPNAVAQAVAPRLSLTSLARFAMTSRSNSAWLPDARLKLDAITISIEAEIDAFSDRTAEGLNGASPALRRLGELPPIPSRALLWRALTEYRVQNEAGHNADDEIDNAQMDAIVASRIRFGTLCEQVAALPHDDWYPGFASQLARDALLETYNTGQQWNQLNTSEPLRQVMPVLAALPERARRQLAGYLKTNAVPMIRVDHRAEAITAIKEALRPEPQSILCGMIRR